MCRGMEWADEQAQSKARGVALFWSLVHRLEAADHIGVSFSLLPTYCPHPKVGKKGRAGWCGVGQAGRSDGRNERQAVGDCLGHHEDTPPPPPPQSLTAPRPTHSHSPQHARLLLRKLPAERARFPRPTPQLDALTHPPTHSPTSSQQASMADPTGNNNKVSYGFQFLSQVEEKGPGRAPPPSSSIVAPPPTHPPTQAPPPVRRSAADILASKYVCVCDSSTPPTHPLTRPLDMHRGDTRRHRPDTDKLFDVVNFLQKVPEHRAVGG